MNEELQQALVAILNKTAAGVEAGAAFLQSELPDVIQQLLIWKAVSSALAFSVAFCVLAICLANLKKQSTQFREYMRGESLYYNNHGNELEQEGKRLREENDGSIPFLIGWACATAISGLVFVIDGISSAGTAIQIWLAPKIYLIEYAASLAK